MPRPRVTKQEVYDAANAIVAKQQMPNVAKIRDLLGHGSFNTIHKYFRNWKQECYKTGAVSNEADLTKYNSLAEENRILKQTLAKQTNKNEELAAQLVDAERNNAKIKEQNLQLQTELSLLKEQQQQVLTAHDKYKAAYEGMEMERDAVIVRMLGKQEVLIESLRSELREVNKASIEQVKEVGRKGDDLLMEEKVKTIYLQDELKQQQQTIEELRDQLLKSQEVIAPLRKEIARQRKFITDVVSFEQLQQYEQQKQKQEFEVGK